MTRSGRSITALISMLQKDSYLSLNLNDKHWWRDHGFLCYSVCNHESDPSDGGGEANGDNTDNGGSGGGELLSILDTLALAGGGKREVGSAAANNDGLGIQRCFASYVVSSLILEKML